MSRNHSPWPGSDKPATAAVAAGGRARARREWFGTPNRRTWPGRAPWPRTWSAALVAAWLVGAAIAQSALELRADIAELLEQGRIDAAVQRAQQALERNRADPEIRREFADLHVTLARRWLAQHRIADCRTALEAALRAAPDHDGARRLSADLAAATKRAGEQVAAVSRLLRIELFEAALDRMREIRALRPDLAPALKGHEKAAWLGAADDHYLAKNFNESFSLYENLLSLDAGAPADVCSRWAVSLALALSETEWPPRADAQAAGRLLARAIDVLKRTNEPIIGQIIGGLLAERAGQPLDAGKAYCEALGEAWKLPPAENRRAAVEALRRRAVEAARRIYEETPPRRRTGLWEATLRDVWKTRATEHFDVSARSDLIAERVAEALEHHFDALSRWLELGSGPGWRPKCEVRIYETLERLHQETRTTGATRAVSRTRLEDLSATARQISVYQMDPWLLSSTLPHELTHLLTAEWVRLAAGETRQQADAAGTARPEAASGPNMAARTSVPLALDEGLAIQAEPPARRLLYRRLLAAEPFSADDLIRSARIDGDQVDYYARADALAEFLLAQRGAAGTLSFCVRTPSPWWREFGFPSATAADEAWRTWCDARRRPARMPLMILTPPSAEQRGK